MKYWSWVQMFPPLHHVSLCSRCISVISASLLCIDKVFWFYLFVTYWLSEYWRENRVLFSTLVFLTTKRGVMGFSAIITTVNKINWLLKALWQELCVYYTSLFPKSLKPGDLKKSSVQTFFSLLLLLWLFLQEAVLRECFCVQRVLSIRTLTFLMPLWL